MLVFLLDFFLLFEKGDLLLGGKLELLKEVSEGPFFLSLIALAT